MPGTDQSGARVASEGRDRLVSFLCVGLPFHTRPTRSAAGGKRLAQCAILPGSAARYGMVAGMLSSVVPKCSGRLSG
jgi:hypothetical protein